MINAKDFSNYDDLADHVANLLKDKDKIYKMIEHYLLQYQKSLDYLKTRHQIII